MDPHARTPVFSRRPIHRPIALWTAAGGIGLMLNLPVLGQRWRGFYADTSPALTALGLASEAALLISLSALLLALATLLGRATARILGSLLILASAACAFFMAKFNVVIGFGVVQALFTTDHDLSHEVIGLDFVLAWLLLGGLPALLWWRRGVTLSWWRAPRARHALGQVLLSLLAAALLFTAAQKSLAWLSRQLQGGDTGMNLNLAGVAAHAYVPSNWLAGVGMVANRAWVTRHAEQQLIDPARRHRYAPATTLDDLVVVLVIGETARHDRFGVLGHPRNTTPHMATERNLVALAARSCDTATKLSLACMFVRPEGLVHSSGPAPDTVLERDVFSVYRHLGFRIDLFGMQSEAGFYSRTGADFYKLREVIVAQPENQGRPAHDMLLVPELRHAVAQHARRPPPAQAMPAGHPGGAGQRTAGRPPQLVILHTKGSHYLYSQRYPREFARWTPECTRTDARCSRDEFLNAFDNSIAYTDHVLHEVRNAVRGRRALVVYSSDHGESIDDGTHFHATPRHIAPPDQRRVPLVFWASDRFLADPVLAAGYRRLTERSRTLAPEVAGHHNLFASLLGCIGVQSPDGGITPADNLCH